MSNFYIDLPESAMSDGISQLTGDVEAGPGSGTQVATIPSNTVTLAQMKNLAANSILGNNTGSSATPIALTAAQVNTFLATTGAMTSIAAAGSSPNSAGGTLTTHALTLQPADGTNPGLITAGTQAIGGAKTFNAAVKLGADSTTPTHAINTATNTTGVGAGTLTNAPTAGNPAGYITITVNGIASYIPFWQ